MDAAIRPLTRRAARPICPRCVSPPTSTSSGPQPSPSPAPSEPRSSSPPRHPPSAPSMSSTSRFPGFARRPGQGVAHAPARHRRAPARGRRIQRLRRRARPAGRAARLGVGRLRPSVHGHPRAGLGVGQRRWHPRPARHRSLIERLHDARDRRPRGLLLPTGLHRRRSRRRRRAHSAADRRRRASRSRAAARAAGSPSLRPDCPKG